MDEANLNDQKLKVPELPPGKLFHIFFSYAENDREFTCRLIDKLENELELKCCEHTRDFTPGWPVIDNIKHCVMSSLKTVVIVSTESVKSQWCSYESEMTLHLSMDMRRKILIPMIIDDCTIPDHLKPLTYIDARGDAAQWWPKLLLAIQSPAEIPIFESGLPILSSEPFSFNLHYSNLETLVNLESKRRLCFQEEIRSQTVPYSLCTKGIQVPHGLFEEQMKILNRTPLFKYYHLWYQRTGCTKLLFSVLISIFLCGIFLRLIAAYTGQNFITDTLHRISLKIVLASITPFFLFTCLCFMRYKKEKNLFKVISKSNARFLPYQVMLTYKLKSRTRGFTIYFVYYNYQPCLDYVLSRLQKTLKNPATNHRVKDMLPELHLVDDICDKTPLLDCPSENSWNCTVHKNEDYNIGLQANQLSEDILLRHSAQYLRLFLDEKLSRPEPPRHTTPVVCLCQYVENIEHFPSPAD